MANSMIVKVGAAACAAALSMALVGCGSAASTSATEAQKANRAYMSQVNETMVELDENLDLFVAAVSRGDVVNMRTQADNAYKTLDKLSSIEAPDELKSVREDYVNGTAKLRAALDAYIDLYAQQSKTGIDAATFDARMKEIQALYDEGVAALKKGDETAAGTSTSSASAPASSISAATSSSSEAQSPATSEATQSAESSAAAQSSDSSAAQSTEPSAAAQSSDTSAAQSAQSAETSESSQPSQSAESSQSSSSAN